MANVTRCKVSLEDIRGYKPNGSKYEQEKFFRIMFSLFKKRVNEAGILSLYKEKQYYESPGEKRRRKKKEQDLERRKQKWNSHFG